MNLIHKITNKTAKVVVVGLGYVGLPMAVTACRKGFNVLGVDVSTHAVNSVNAGKNYIGDVCDAELKKYVDEGKLTATLDYKEISDGDVIMIAVPTPLDKWQQPDSSYVKESTASIAAHVSADTLVVLESTTYPGTTEEIIAPALEEKGFTIGEDIFVSFSPERVDPGNEVYKTNNTPKVVGGMTAKCNEISKLFYEAVLDAEIHLVSSPAVAEMEKIFENTFRNINIALSNEMVLLCDRMKINIWEVIDAAKTKPYGFMAFYPGPGIGGHCIPLDPFYLTWKAREFNYHTRLIEVAGEINNAMPEFVVDKAARILNHKGLAISKSKILLLGAAYKKDIEDMRESAIMHITVELEKRHADFAYNDPHVPSFHNELNDKHYNSIELENIEDYDIVIVLTAHAKFDKDIIFAKAQHILDTRNMFKGYDNNKITLL